MSVEELVKNLKCIGTHDETELWEVIEEAADKLEELAAEAHEWKDRVRYLSKCIDEKSADEDRLKAALAEKDKENEALREALEQVYADAVSIGRGENSISDKARGMVEAALARNAGGKDAE